MLYKKGTILRFNDGRGYWIKLEVTSDDSPHGKIIDCVDKKRIGETEGSFSYHMFNSDEVEEAKWSLDKENTVLKLLDKIDNLAKRNG